MIVSRGRGYVFVHIPKTGGTSMALALEGRAMADDVLVGDTPKARRRKRRLEGVQTAGRLWKHSTLADGEGLYAREELDDLFCVTLVRNPWDRVASYYRWARVQNFDHPAVRLARTVDFESFVEDAGTRASLAAAPYASYMRDGAGRERADLYVRLEHFATDVTPFERHLGVVLALPHANVSSRPDGDRDPHTQRTRAIVAEVCAEDIARFGYTCG